VVKRGWGGQHNEELNDLYCLPNIVQVIKPSRMRWTGHVERMGRGEQYIRFWVKSWGTETTLRIRQILEDNIKMNLQEVGCGDMDY
jgi:hypothetical protein